MMEGSAEPFAWTELEPGNLRQEKSGRIVDELGETASFGSNDQSSRIICSIAGESCRFFPDRGKTTTWRRGGLPPGRTGEVTGDSSARSQSRSGRIWVSISGRWRTVADEHDMTSRPSAPTGA